ncbi:MAG: serine hydrolase domain-containing protein [Armatimonas sp.]
MWQTSKQQLAEPIKLVSDAVKNGIPGAVLRIDVGGKPLVFEAFGTAKRDTIFDLASVTKCAATTTACALLVQEGKLKVNEPVGTYLPAFAEAASPERRTVTLRHLLTHTAGFPAGGAYSGKTVPLSQLVTDIARSRRASAPGEQFLYSDFSAILLGAVIEAVAQTDLRLFCSKRIYSPLGMNDTGYRPSWRQIPRCAPCLPDPKDAGKVHDPTATAAERAGYVTGHAGLFSTAEDLAKFSLAWLGRTRFLDNSVRTEFTHEQAFGRGLGWDLSSPYTIRGTLSPVSFGHTGFTGTSIWIDPARDLSIILLTNAVFGGDAPHKACIPLRRLVSTAVAKEIPAH